MGVYPLSGLILRRIPSIDARQTYDVSTPSTKHPSTEGIGDRECDTCKEVIALEASRLESQFVVLFWKLAGPVHAGHWLAGFEEERSVLYADVAVVGEGGHLPTGQWSRLVRANHRLAQDALP